MGRRRQDRHHRRLGRHLRAQGRFRLTKPFGSICDLIASAEGVKKLSAICLECSADAHFTFKHGAVTGEINDIGGLEKYIPVCRKCFVMLSQGTRTPSQSLTPVKVKPTQEKETLGLSDETEDSDKKSVEAS